MPHTPLAKLLRHAASTAAQSCRRDATANESTMSRREFVRTISAATAGLALPSSMLGARQVTTNARVVVVGAGLAGLTCAYRLKRSGINAAVYEANTRLGAVVGADAVISRMDTLQNMAANSSIRGTQRPASLHRNSAYHSIICSQRNRTVRPSSSTSVGLHILIAMPFVI